MCHHFPLHQLVNNPGLKHISEEIFSYLEPKSLAACRLTCTSWRNLIDNHRRWWVLHLQQVRTRKVTFFATHFKESSEDFFLERFPHWESTWLHFETKAKLLKLKEFVGRLYSNYFLTLPTMVAVNTIYGQCPVFEAAVKGNPQDIGNVQLWLTSCQFCTLDGVLIITHKIKSRILITIIFFFWKSLKHIKL